MIDSMVCKAGLAALVALTFSACASFKPVNQEVALRVTDGGERAEATCEVSNDRASWTVVAPVNIAVTRSDQRPIRRPGPVGEPVPADSVPREDGRGLGREHVVGLEAEQREGVAGGAVQRAQAAVVVVLSPETVFSAAAPE